jgi:hypothetical protein
MLGAKVVEKNIEQNSFLKKIQFLETCGCLTSFFPSDL